MGFLSISGVGQSLLLWGSYCGWIACLSAQNSAGGVEMKHRSLTARAGCACRYLDWRIGGPVDMEGYETLIRPCRSRFARTSRNQGISVLQLHVGSDTALLLSR